MNKELAESQLVDSTYISLIVMLSRTIKIIQLISLLLFGSYFLGVFWYIICDKARIFQA